MSEPIRLHVSTAQTSSLDQDPETATGAVLRVAKRLASCELALDKALIEACTLAAEIPQARLAANLAMSHGQDALEELAASIAGIATARRHVIAGHDRLNETRRDLGVQEVAVGDKWLRTPAFADLRRMVEERRTAA